MLNQHPVTRFREGPVSASVWFNPSPKGGFYDVAFTRSYKDPAGDRNGYSRSFSERHLDALITVALQAKNWISDQPSADPAAPSDDGPT